MKKILSFIIVLTMVLSVAIVCSAETESVVPTVTYSFGEAETITDADGSIIKKIPLKATVNAPITNVTVNVKFDNNSLEYIPYASASDKGDIRGIMLGDLTEADKSVIGFAYMVSSGSSTVNLSDTTVCYFRFKVKHTATSGDKTLVITKSDVSYEDETEQTEKEKTKTVKEYTYTNGVVSIVDEEIPEAPETPEEPEEGGEVIPDISGDETEDEPETENPRPAGPTVVAPVEVKVSFDDLDGYEWATEYILELAKKGVIKGVSENNFAPGNKITRADFMVLLMRLLKVDGEPTETFADIDSSAYYAKDVLNAKKLGIAKGSDGNFNPSGSISRQDLCTFVYRALEIKGYLPELSESKEGFDAQYGDTALISSYAYDAMKALSELKIINGSGGNINPTGSATRAETAAIIYRLSNLIESK